MEKIWEIPMNLKVVETVLERMRHSHQMVIGRQVAENMTIERLIPYVTDEMVYRISTDVWAEKLVDDTIPVQVEQKYQWRTPAGWWQQFKQEWFPQWARDRWPVKWREDEVTLHTVKQVNIRQYLKYPENDHLFHNRLGRAVVYETVQVVG